MSGNIQEFNREIPNHQQSQTTLEDKINVKIEGKREVQELFSLYGKQFEGIEDKAHKHQPKQYK
jgi:hypothetical protein